MKSTGYFRSPNTEIPCETLTSSWLSAAAGTTDAASKAKPAPTAESGRRRAGRVRTIAGKKVQLAVPPGTQGGTRFRLAGQGIEKDGSVGDQYVEIQIRIPEDLSDEDREMVERLAKRTR